MMRPREAPMARRTAISRSRALALANIRLARLAHAMRRTSPAIASSSQSGALVVLTQRRDARRSRKCAEAKLTVLLRGAGRVGRRHGSGEERWRDGVQLRRCALDRPPRFQPTDDSQPPGAPILESRAGASRQGFRTDRERDVERRADVHAMEARGATPMIGNELPVEADAPSQHLTVAAVALLPEPVAEHGTWRWTAGSVVRVRDGASQSRLDSQRAEEVAAHPQAARCAATRRLRPSRSSRSPRRRHARSPVARREGAPRADWSDRAARR